ncbi:MAG: hypothetical protein QM809_09175 [Gordonia sp. (in: high G+C Gram-positive bacteria)]|uniref:hypothetical protein n=1 Tax=Gordonia sp. (in: high G+C Gram-positive bacteria) TaxID=84139 RepID=UPI0039E29A29
MGEKKPDPAKVAHLKPKRKCCKKRVRCLKCPVVVHKMKRLDLDSMSKKDARKALENARVNPGRRGR